MSPRIVLSVALFLLSAFPSAADLIDEIGRSESRIRSEAYPLVAGRTVWEIALAERLEAQGYERVRVKPEAPGEFFWGNETFWIYRRAHRYDGENHKPLLFGLRLGDKGRILGGLDADSSSIPLAERGHLRLEPELLAESLTEARAVRVPLRFEDLPEHVWRPLLAAEDARFFNHRGVDARSLARALLSNLKAGKVKQGGSTITQQLIKNRDLTPKRTLRRKASEALRALALEAEYDKEEILEAYLDQVYLGHVDGLAVHGFGTGARVFFSKKLEEIDLAEAALLAAIVQGPNRLSPIRHPKAAEKRRNWVLSRLGEVGWASDADVAAAQSKPIRLRRGEVRHPLAPHFRGWVKSVAEDKASRRLKKKRGVVVETALDPHLQRLAEKAVADGLKRLRRDHRRLRDAPLAAALVALDVETGAVLAYVGGDPKATGDAFDRGRRALRQPGSTVKPLILLEAFEDCGSRDPLAPSSRVDDAPLTVDLPSGPWSPRNDDDEHRGVVELREAIRHSLNVPFVRTARWCGFDDVADRFRDAGLDLPKDVQPAFALGAVETTPLDLAAVYTVFATPGSRVDPRPLRRLEQPNGDKIKVFRPREERVASPESAWLVRELLRDVAGRGTARGASVEGLDVVAKTGTSSQRRDAWLAGSVDGVVAVVWVGRDDDEPLGLGGSQAAAPLWQNFMEQAAVARPPRRASRPPGVVTLYVDERTGLLVRSTNPRARKEVFRQGALPRRDRFWRVDRPAPVIR